MRCVGTHVSCVDTARHCEAGAAISAICDVSVGNTVRHCEGGTAVCTLIVANIHLTGLCAGLFSLEPPSRLDIIWGGMSHTLWYLSKRMSSAVARTTTVRACRT